MPDFTNQYNTALPPEQEAKFQEWAKTAKNGAGGSVMNDLPDYDVRGRWQQLEAMPPQERAVAEAPGAHGPDTWKKPSHITFSNESRYHGVDGHEGGTWGKTGGQDNFTPGATNLAIHSRQGLSTYFQQHEPGIILNLPPEQPPALSAYRPPAPQAGGQSLTDIYNAAQQPQRQ